MPHKKVFKTFVLVYYIHEQTAHIASCNNERKKFNHTKFKEKRLDNFSFTSGVGD